MIEKWWVILFVVNRLLVLGIYIGKDGEPKEGKYSVGCELFRALIAFTLAWLGGVFRCFE